MGKVFLSHSSADKNYVEIVYDLLGKDKCVYDIASFEIGLKNVDEIARNLDKTDIFVLFISENSLSSEWVKTEILNAQNNYFDSEKLLNQFFPIIIDSSNTYKDERIPDWIRNGKTSYNLYVETPLIAARKILTQLAYATNLNYTSTYNFFYGRDVDIMKFKQFYDSVQYTPRCIIATGLEGISKTSYIKQCVYSVNAFPAYYSVRI